MTKDEAMKLALEALENSQRFVEASANAKMLHGWGEQLDTAEDAITSLHQAISELEQRSIAEAEKQEPFEYWNAVEGWVKLDEVREHFHSVSCGTIYKNEGEGRVPLYANPQPKREWVGLTDDDEIPWDGVDAKSFARAIEAKLKEKNK